MRGEDTHYAINYISGEGGAQQISKFMNCYFYWYMP